LNFGISFTPLVPAYVVWAAAGIAFLVSLLVVLGRSRGALVRVVALALFVMALANPSITREDRDPLTSVAVVVVDKSPSQELGDRTAQTDAARAQWPSGSPACPTWSTLRRARQATARPTAPGCSRRCPPRSPTCARAHRRRILITDGRVHDVPGEAAALGFAAPLHALITGHKGERDRRVVLVTTPRFGIVGRRRPSPSASRTRARRPARRR